MEMYQHIKYTSDFRDFLFIDKQNPKLSYSFCLFVCLSFSMLHVWMITCWLYWVKKCYSNCLDFVKNVATRGWGDGSLLSVCYVSSRTSILALSIHIKAGRGDTEQHPWSSWSLAFVRWLHWFSERSCLKKFDSHKGRHLLFTSGLYMC